MPAPKPCSNGCIPCGSDKSFPRPILRPQQLRRLGVYGRNSASRSVPSVYTVRFAGVVYVLHAFQKKAKKGIATPPHEIELIRSHPRDAEVHYRARIEKGGRNP